MSPKVSVCIDSFNYGRFLPEAIESVLKQSFLDFELIIGDDCSNDDSIEIARNYAAKDKRIVIEGLMKASLLWLILKCGFTSWNRVVLPTFEIRCVPFGFIPGNKPRKTARPWRLRWRIANCCGVISTRTMCSCAAGSGNISNT